MNAKQRLKRAFQAAISIGVLAAVWQIASLLFPPFLFPSITAIVERTIEIFLSGPLLFDVIVTGLRIFAGLLGAFVFGGIIALLIARSPTLENYANPVLIFLQGIPALSWVVIAIIWFHGIEFRIFFIMVMTTLPAF